MREGLETDVAGAADVGVGGVDYVVGVEEAYRRDAIVGEGVGGRQTDIEFGLDENGNVVLGDEMLTPDSSRFWPLDGYKPGQGQPSFDKQYVRDWLKANPDSGYKLPDDVVEKTTGKYKEAFQMLTGKEFTR